MKKEIFVMEKKMLYGKKVIIKDFIRDFLFFFLFM